MDYKYVHKRREELGFSQRKLAKMAKVPQSCLSVWERGLWSPRSSKAELRLLKVLTRGGSNARRKR